MTTAAGTRSIPDAPRAAEPSLGGVAKWGRGVLVYTLLVILFGAVVRITGSGAGCGQHWPTCQGELVHLPKTVETLIELSHRVTSGLSAVAVGGLVVLSFRRSPPGHAVRKFAVASGALMLTESLVGAALVLLRLVGHNTSVARAVVMAIHLVNTSFLMGAIALTTFVAAQERAPTFDWRRRFAPTSLALLGAALVVSITGAVTALGDTLYPPESAASLAARLAADQSLTATFLERGRAVHPLVAFTAAVVMLSTLFRIRSESSANRRVERATGRALALVFAQVVAGIANVLLSAPGYMQVIHLCIATLLWLSLVVVTAELARET